MRAHEEGFGLVEIMVGLGIGMLAMIVVLQVYSQSEGQKRSTTGGADAQTNGAIALTMIERDVRNGGWGLGVNNYSGCATMYTYCDGSDACGGAEGAISDFSLASVIITDGGTKPDTVTAQYYADPNVGGFRLPTNTVVTDNMPEPSSELIVSSTEGCNEGDLMLAEQDGKCTLMQVTNVQNQPLHIQHNKGANGIYNPAADFSKKSGWPQYTIGAKLTCFTGSTKGPLFKRTYSIDTALRQLLRSDNATDSLAQKEVASPEIVDLQAEYGVADPAVNPQKVTQWVAATVAPWDKPDKDARNRIKAVRIALLARSAQYEKPGADGKCNATTDDMVKAWSTWAKFSTSTFPADWKCYRYKEFETIVPLRNVLWGNV